MNLHMQPIKVHRVMIYSPKKRKEKRGFQSSLLLFHPLLLVKLLLHLITNWNPKWLTDFRCHVSTVRMLTERTSLPYTIPHSRTGEPWPCRSPEEDCSFAFSCTSNSCVWAGPKQQSSIFFLLEGELLERRKVRLSFKHLVVFFFTLVW